MSEKTALYHSPLHKPFIETVAFINSSLLAQNREVFPSLSTLLRQAAMQNQTCSQKGNYPADVNESTQEACPNPNHFACLSVGVFLLYGIIKDKFDLFILLFCNSLCLCSSYDIIGMSVEIRV